MCRSWLVGAVVWLLTTVSWAQWVVDFEDLTLAPESAAPATGLATATPFVSRLVSFNRKWNEDFDCCPAAWAYSNQTDLTTAGFANPYSAYALPIGGGVHGSANFAIANNSFLGEAVITLPGSTTVQGLYVANNTYAYLAVANGNDGQEPGQPPQFVKGPFEEGDWFKLEIVGRDQSGMETARVPFYLADFRGGASVVIDGWAWVDLTPLGSDVASLAFELSSTDNGMFGMNTPAYFAIDDLTLQVLPGDFNADFGYTCDDVDALVAEIASGTNDPTFDIAPDGIVDENDLAVWLELAGAANLESGDAYLAGDANLDGSVDGDDFSIWNGHKFTSGGGWCAGDFDASGAVDGRDFLIWNALKFQHAGGQTVPEPTAWCCWLWGVALLTFGQRVCPLPRAARRSYNRQNP